MQFNFQVSQKVTVWRDSTFVVEAETKERAEQIVKERIDDENFLEDETLISWTDIGYDLGTEDTLTEEQNNGEPVIIMYGERT